MHGFDLLGVVPLGQHLREKALASGQRALSAGQRIAKASPKLSAAVMAAGQKALAAGKRKPGAKAPAAGPNPAPGDQATPSKSASPALAPPPARNVLAAKRPIQSPPDPKAAARPTGRPMPAKALPGKTHLGEDETVDLLADTDEAAQDQAADLYSQLADAATQAADFVALLQGLKSQLPPELPIAQEGQGKVDTFSIWFVNPIEKSLTGELKATPDFIAAVLDLLKFTLDQKTDPPQNSVWTWVNKARAYLKAHPPIVPAVVTVSPAEAVLKPGTKQALTVAVTGSTGQPYTPSSLAWTVSSGGTVDPAGTFSAAAAGVYTVTATADGVPGTATMMVQASQDAAAPTTAPTTTAPAPAAPALPAPGVATAPASYTPSAMPSSTPYEGSYPSGFDAYAIETDPYASDYGTSQPPYQEPEEEPMASDYENESEMNPGDESDLLGRGGGGRGGGGGGHGGHHHHGGRRRGGGWGPYFYPTGYYPDVIELMDDTPIDIDPDAVVEEVADAIADRLAGKKTKRRHKNKEQKTEVGGLDFFGVDDVLGAFEFAVNKKERGEGTYNLHGVGDASRFAPGVTLFTPDGIIWDVVSVDPDRKGLTVAKKRDEVSYPAWASGWMMGEWSKLTGEAPVAPPTLAMKALPALNWAKETFDNTVDSAKTAGSYLPWVLGGAAVIAVGAVAAPVVMPLMALRGRR